MGSLANDMVSIEQAIRERRAELSGLEGRMNEAKTNLASVQTQVSSDICFLFFKCPWLETW